ncbi:MAG: hypothetical protein ABFS14_09760 [Gemmatimonadota bacterium]
MRMVIGTAKGLVTARWVPGERKAQVVARTLEGEAVQALERSGDRVVAAVGTGIHVSADGEQWESLPAPGAGGRVSALAAHAHDPNLLLAGTEPAGLFRSADGGRTWQEVVGFAALGQAESWGSYGGNEPCVGSVALDPTNQHRLYAGVRIGGAYRSEDSGASWVSISEGLFEDVHQLAVDPVDSTRVYAATGRGLHISRDRGGSWDTPGGPLGEDYCTAVETMVESGFRHTHLLASSAATSVAEWSAGKSAEARLYLSEDAGRSWQDVDLSSGPKQKAALTALADDPQRAEAGFIGTSAGAVYHGRIVEGQWSRIMSGLSNVMGLIVW